MPVRTGQPGHGQDGTPGRDDRARQVDPDLRVVPDRLFGLVQPNAGRLEPLGMQLADRPAVSWAARLRAYATILGRPPEAAAFDPGGHAWPA